MGDRALIQFEDDRGEYSPAVYLHWHGPEVATLIDQWRERMVGRMGDLDYCAARFVGLAHEMIEGNTGLGICNMDRRLVKEDSPGDAGCFVVNVNTGQADTFGGYGFHT